MSQQTLTEVWESDGLVICRCGSTDVVIADGDRMRQVRCRTCGRTVQYGPAVRGEHYGDPQCRVVEEGDP